MPIYCRSTFHHCRVAAGEEVQWETSRTPCSALLISCYWLKRTMHAHTHNQSLCVQLQPSSVISRSYSFGRCVCVCNPWPYAWPLTFIIILAKAIQCLCSALYIGNEFTAVVPNHILPVTLYIAQNVFTTQTQTLLYRSASTKIIFTETTSASYINVPVSEIVSLNCTKFACGCKSLGSQFV